MSDEDKIFGVWVTEPNGTGGWCKRLGAPFELIRTNRLEDANSQCLKFELNFPPNIHYEVREVHD